MTQGPLFASRATSKPDSMTTKKLFIGTAIGMVLCATSLLFDRISHPEKTLIRAKPSSTGPKPTNSTSNAKSYDIGSSIEIEPDYIHQSSIKETRELIVGGEPASKDDNYEFFVHFEGKTSTCGGSLIAPNVVLSAGHCWKMNLPDPWIGPIYDTEKTERKIGRIAEYRVHPDYALKSTYYNDFLLVRLSSIDTVEWEPETEDDIAVSLPWLDSWDDRRRRASQTTTGKQRLRARSLHVGERG
eukprot:CAMPEP_0116119020 /NCGR_PEP_ID=MMETSP0329-20121206/2417_1 /TAXON_ID=697910 /ORGANISM="Pseudo-nitzschia arenysensis, Strain B593" /LENGTH=242 /DNA_ID=CAMNT_0003612691 /DNA_START=75 /DNA_END=799 /DNA_ORIENTATION=+